MVAKVKGVRWPRPQPAQLSSAQSDAQPYRMGPGPSSASSICVTAPLHCALDIAIVTLGITAVQLAGSEAIPSEGSCAEKVQASVPSWNGSGLAGTDMEGHAASTNRGATGTVFDTCTRTLCSGSAYCCGLVITTVPVTKPSAYAAYAVAVMPWQSVAGGT